MTLRLLLTTRQTESLVVDTAVVQCYGSLQFESFVCQISQIHVTFTFWYDCPYLGAASVRIQVLPAFMSDD